jgi:uncharacterized membrane protein YraQ (UPF0718 family)
VTITNFLPALITSFFSVLVGALPFLVVAAFASAALEVFVSSDQIARWIPRNGILGVLLVPVFGLLIPMCDCGIVPVARRMVQKGVPGATAIAFMLSNPILNPLSIYSTYLAFPFARQMVWWRIGLGYTVSVVIGLLIHVGLLTVSTTALDDRAARESGHEHSHDHTHVDQTLGQRLQEFLNHATSELFSVLKYFVIGAGIASFAQQVINRPMLELLGSGRVMSVLVMMVFAYLVCTCSEADAFVAATFASTFTPGALLAFLVAGPMTDMKNTIMMLDGFKKRTVVEINLAIFGLVAVSTICLNFWLHWGG